MPEEIYSLLQKNYEQLKSKCTNYGELKKKIERQYQEDTFTSCAYAKMQLEINLTEFEKDLINTPIQSSLNLLTINEKRERVGLQRIDGGDVILVPQKTSEDKCCMQK